MNSHPWRVIAVAVAFGVALAGSSWAAGTREMPKGFPVPGGVALKTHLDLSCTAWFAKDSAGTKYPVPTIVEAWNGGSIWVFYAITNPAKQAVNNVQVDGKVSSAFYYPDNYPLMLPANKAYLEKYVKFLSGVKYPAKTLSVPAGNNSFKLDQHAFWSMWEAWKPNSGLHSASLKWVVEVHLVASDKKCSTPMITLQYNNLP